jgi:GAF domain-containing protein
VAGADMTGHREVLQRISQSHLDPAPSPERHEPADTAAASTSLLAFVSLSRVASGDATVADVLALGSRLIGDVVPGVTGAWFLQEANGDRLVAIEAFGPSAPAVRGSAVVVGDRLTGWVAANRQPIINSPANLDLGPRVEAMEPALRTCMSLPLLQGDALVAVLSLYSPETDAFDEATGRLIQMVAPHLAAAIHAAVAGAASAAEPKPAAEKPAGGPLRLVATR